ncbi:MAG: hypothetical protein ACK5KU_08820 [Beutenbergiaceae bacterium]
MDQEAGFAGLAALFADVPLDLSPLDEELLGVLSEDELLAFLVVLDGFSESELPELPLLLEVESELDLVLRASLR